MKHQIVTIHGGDYAMKDFASYLKRKKVTIENFKPRYDWKANLQTDIEKLGLKNKFEVISPRMPNSQNTHYNEWKIWFEKLIPFLKNDMTLIGHSLGGIFLIKYLAENIFPKRIHAVMLVAAPYETKTQKGLIANNFILGEKLSGLSKQCKKLYFFHSKNDAVVPFSDFKKFKAIFPDASFFIFNNRGHFNGDSFPELLEALLESF